MNRSASAGRTSRTRSLRCSCCCSCWSAPRPLLPWRATSRSRSLARLRLPVMRGRPGDGRHGASPALRHLEAVAGFGLAALVMVTNGQELLTGVLRVDGGATSAVRSDAAGRALRRPAGARRAGRPGRRDHRVVRVGRAVRGDPAHEGQSVAFAGHRLRYDGLTTTREPQRTVLTTRLAVTDGSGAAAGALTRG